MPELIYALIADAIALLHGFIAAALGAQFIFGVVLRRKFPAWWSVCLVPAIFVAFGGYIFLQDCPVNPVERYFRDLAGQEVHNGSFIGHYLTRVGIDINPVMLESSIGLVLGLLLLDVISRRWARSND